MIGKVVRGNDIGGLLRYLFGPGRANEHTNPHVVAAWDDGVVAAHTSEGDVRLKRLTALLEQPLAALDNRPSPAVWHCPLRTAPGDRPLTEAEWADVAAEVLHQTGLAPRGDAFGCRWVAVRHADDHIHLAVTLARQDGRRARTSHDYAKLGAACRTTEERYGLKLTPARNRTAPKRPTRAEKEKAARLGASETPRQRLRREVHRAALTSTDLDHFVENLRREGVQVSLRLSQIEPNRVTGYSVARPDEHSPTENMIWFGGGKLAPHLSLPRLEGLWTQSKLASSTKPLPTPPARRLSSATVLRMGAIATRHLENGHLADGTVELIGAALKVVPKRSGR